MQLEILLNAVHLILGKCTPLIVLASTVMACTSTVMLLHINPARDDQGCASCAFLLQGIFALSAWLGGFFVYQLLEQLSEESGAVLKKIDEGIIAQAMGSKRLYGTQLVRRSFAVSCFVLSDDCRQYCKLYFHGQSYRPNVVTLSHCKAIDEKMSSETV